jgi:hypothetical protein
MMCLRNVTVEFLNRLRLTCYYVQVALAHLFYVLQMECSFYLVTEPATVTARPGTCRISKR